MTTDDSLLWTVILKNKPHRGTYFFSIESHLWRLICSMFQVGISNKVFSSFSSRPFSRCFVAKQYSTCFEWPTNQRFILHAMCFI